MRRRVLLASTAAATLSSATLRAQQKAMPVIGFLGTDSPGPAATSLAAFREGLKETGFVVGQNLLIEYRWAEGQYDRLPALVAEFVDRKVDVIVTSAGADVARAAKQATTTTPIVFAAGNPVESGLVTNLARPGGNLTGVSFNASELGPKRLEFLRELVPNASVIALLVNPTNSTAERLIQDMNEAAQLKGVQIEILKARSESEIETAFGSLTLRQAGALVVSGDPFINSRGRWLVELAARHAVPTIYGSRELVLSGGLISLGPNGTAVLRQAGVYAGKILKGVKPADLPVVQPTIFELVINMKTARALGLTIPPSILARADEVFE